MTEEKKEVSINELSNDEFDTIPFAPKEKNVEQDVEINFEDTQPEEGEDDVQPEDSFENFDEDSLFDDFE